MYRVTFHDERLLPLPGPYPTLAAAFREILVFYPAAHAEALSSPSDISVWAHQTDSLADDASPGGFVGPVVATIETVES